MKTAKIIGLVAISLFILSGGGAFYRTALAAEADHTLAKGNIRVASAALGTIYDAICNGFSTIVFAKLPNVKISSMSTNGSEENVHLLHDKEVEIAALNQTIIVDALNGTGVFDYKSELYHLFTSHSNQNFFVTRKNSGITKIEDFAGRRIAVGPPGSGTMNNTREILSLGYGMWEKEMEVVYLALGEGADALRDGTIDVLSAYTSSNIPPSYLTELDTTLDDLVYVGLSQQGIANIRKTMPYLTGSVVEAPMLTKMKGKILAATTYGNISIHADIPEDLAYALTKAFFSGIDSLSAYHALGAKIRPETALGGVFAGYKVHPGAARYYKEAGVWKDEYEVGTVK